jgi:hypothetical protein
VVKAVGRDLLPYDRARTLRTPCRRIPIMPLAISSVALLEALHFLERRSMSRPSEEKMDTANICTAGVEIEDARGISFVVSMRRRAEEMFRQC